METTTETTLTVEERLKTLETNMEKAYEAVKELELRTVALGLGILAIAESETKTKKEPRNVGFAA